METVDVLVKIFDRGKTRQEIVPVWVECFDPARSCWKPIAALKAAVAMELPFVEVERMAKYGMRPADKKRLRALYGGGTDSSTPASPSLRMTKQGGEQNAEGA